MTFKRAVPKRQVLQQMESLRKRFADRLQIVRSNTAMAGAYTTGDLVNDMEMDFDRLYGTWVSADKEMLRLQVEVGELEERLESKPEPDGLVDMGAVFEKWITKAFPVKDISEDLRELLYDGWLIAYHQALKEKLVSERMSHHNLRETLDLEFRKRMPNVDLSTDSALAMVRDSVVAALHGMAYDEQTPGIFNGDD